MKRLIYVSNNVLSASNKQNPFFLQEKERLLAHFGAFDVVCPKGIYTLGEDGELSLRKPVGVWGKIGAFLAAGFDLELYKELIHMIKDKAFGVSKALKLCKFAVKTAQVRSLLEKCIDRESEENTIVYSFWLSFDAAAVAKVKKKHPKIYAFARAHSYEVQLEKNICNPYLMKRLICKHLDKIAFISQDSLKSFYGYYKKKQDNICVHYLGSVSAGEKRMNYKVKDELTVLSCSLIVPVKQLDWIVCALEKWDCGKIRWVHIGDGPKAEEIREMAKEKLSANSLVTYDFLGYMDNALVHKYMQREDVDVFLNASSVEGIPVSIMEAMSVGLPVVAPNICGIPELVNRDCGILFTLSDGTDGLRNALVTFAKMNEKQRADMGTRGLQQWQDGFCLDRNLEELLSTLKLN